MNDEKNILISSELAQEYIDWANGTSNSGMHICDRLASEIEEQIKGRAKFAITYEKKIAHAILDAQKMHEESYAITEWDNGDEIAGHYELEIEECLTATCKQQGLSENLWALLDLAMHWWNDIQLWAEDVLVGKNILDECMFENAKMREEDRIKGSIPCCDSSSKEKCEQCRDTDDQGDLKNS